MNPNCPELSLQDAKRENTVHTPKWVLIARGIPPQDGKEKEKKKRRDVEEKKNYTHALPKKKTFSVSSAACLENVMC